MGPVELIIHEAKQADLDEELALFKKKHLRLH
jgi:hypothetical protein